tara:strand:+ start:757 stop:999 length:243 start_codon:yes stop_codon:yes gene_type:complete
MSNYLESLRKEFADAAENFSSEPPIVHPDIRLIEQDMYLIGHGPNLNSIVSETSLDKYTFIGLEKIGIRKIWTIPITSIE